MAQKFTSLEDAANQLGISKDRLNQLREAGKVRAYRDGASWKFRSDDIEKLATDGHPANRSRLERPGARRRPTSCRASSGLDLDMADEAPAGPASDINLEEVDEPTVAGVEDDDSDAMALDLDDDSISLSDSILLSEAELGASPGRPPSTIIGRGELDLDADLDLSPAEKQSGPPSDVILAHPSPIWGSTFPARRAISRAWRKWKSISRPSRAAFFRQKKRPRSRAAQRLRPRRPRPATWSSRQPTATWAARLPTSAWAATRPAEPGSPVSPRWNWKTTKCWATAATSHFPARAAASTSSRRPTADWRSTKWRST